MNVSRSGYYKWLNNKEEKQYQKDRQELIKLVTEIHSKHPSYGYRRINAIIKRKTGWKVSDNYVHKCCKYLEVKSKVNRYKWSRPKGEHITYKNIVKNNWITTRPLEKIVSDMTCIRFKGKLYNLALFLDTFNNEIVSYKLSDRNADPRVFYDGLRDLLKKIKEEQPKEVILHTDQGKVYSSQMFADIHKNYNIIRSMSRSGTPTDNPIIEAINGWFKEEMICDFDYKNEDNLFEFIDKFVHYFNYERPAFKLNYKTPIEYKIQLGF